MKHLCPISSPIVLMTLSAFYVALVKIWVFGSVPQLESQELVNIDRVPPPCKVKHS